MTAAPPSLATLADRVTYLHALSGLEKAVLSQAAGLAPSHLGAMMRGAVQNPASRSVERLALTTGTTIDWIVSGRGRRPTQARVRAAIAAARAARRTGTEG